MNETTKVTPFYVLYGHEANEPINNMLTYELLKDPNDLIIDDTEPVDTRTSIRDEITKSQLKNQDRLNRHRDQPPFKKEDLVIHKIGNRSGKGKKLTNLYKGPYIIEREHENGNSYDIITLNRPTKQYSVNADSLELFHQRDTYKIIDPNDDLSFDRE